MLGFSPLASIPLGADPDVEQQAANPQAVTPYSGGEWDLETLRVALKDRRVRKAERKEAFEEAAIAIVATVADLDEEVRAFIAEQAEELARIRRRDRLDAAISAMLERAVALAEHRAGLIAAQELKRKQDNAALALLLLAA